MKSLAIVLISLSLSTLIYCKTDMKSLDKVGSSSNMNSEMEVAVAYSIAKTSSDQFYIDNPHDFQTPKYVKKLPTRKPLVGPVETIDEIPSIKDYYDGSIKLKTLTVVCNQWTTYKEACMNQKNCGWCASSSSCISGNIQGPLEPCLRGNFEYSSPEETWNPLPHENVEFTRSEVGGAQLSKLNLK